MLLHIGYHKTGSTYLQNRVFDGAIFAFGTISDDDRFLKKEICFQHIDLFDQPGVAQRFKAACSEIASAGRYPVYTNESLSGQLFSGGIESLRTAQRLKAAAPSARVLIVIREQNSILLSSYNQFVRHGGRDTLAQFLTNETNGFLRFHRSHFAYHHLIKGYQDAFGPDKVLVLPYEMLAVDPIEYIDRILQFCGLPKTTLDTTEVALNSRLNPSIPFFGIALKRWINFIAAPSRPGLTRRPIFYSSRWMNDVIKHRLKSFSRRLPDRWSRTVKKKYQHVIEEMIQDYYVESNHQTMALTEIDLGEYGYRLNK